MGNTPEEINTSICAITNYLNNHMKTIVSATLSPGHMSKKILDNIEMFTREFKAAAGVSTTECIIISLDGLDDYKKKILGCQILSSVRKWVEHFSHNSCVHWKHFGQFICAFIDLFMYLFTYHIFIYLFIGVLLNIFHMDL